jgi:hypothetical protein
VTKLGLFGKAFFIGHRCHLKPKGKSWNKMDLELETSKREAVIMYAGLRLRLLAFVVDGIILLLPSLVVDQLIKNIFESRVDPLLFFFRFFPRICGRKNHLTTLFRLPSSPVHLSTVLARIKVSLAKLGG